MRFRPSVLIATIFGEPAPSRKAASHICAVPLCILLLSVLTMCSNPIIENLIEPEQKNRPEITPVTGVILNTNKLILTVDGSTTLLATVQPDNATNKAVTWSSTNDLVATVSSNGLVTALAEGDATITVTTIDGGNTASCEVTVKAAVPGTVAVTGISLDTTGLTLAVSETETLTAAVLPENATNQDVTWSSGNPSVATVDVASGFVTALAEGYATITVTTVSEGKTASCKVTVVIPVTGVSLNTSMLTLPVGDTETLTAEVEPENATNQNVTWSSSDDLIATVSDSGLVTALTAGDATITVTTVDGNHTESCPVFVRKSDGEPDTPFLIYNEPELRKVGTGTDGWVLSACYKLMEDITLNGEWTPIGDNETRFTGMFNGNNKTITGLSINKPNEGWLGMFGLIGREAEIKYLTLVDCYVHGNNNVGGIVGENEGTVHNCNVTGMVSGTDRVGGVVGLSRSLMIDCYATGNVKGDTIVGGVVGENDGLVRDSHATGDVTGNDQTGGVAGVNRDAVVNCYATGDVTGNRIIGGVVGKNYSRNSIYGDSSKVENCYSTGNVSGEGDQVGGVVGRNGDTEISKNITVKDCYATGNVRGNDQVGGVVGWNQSVLESCYATGDVNGNIEVGGVLGNNRWSSTNSYATGNVSGNESVGGVAGLTQNRLDSCYATGVVSGNKNVGGVAGKFSSVGGSGVIENCVALNPNINSTEQLDGSYILYGRIIGYNDENPNGYIINNYARRDMKHNSNAGKWINTTNDRDGADITPANYNLQTWWGSHAYFDFDSSAETGFGWEWHNASRLPKLKGLGTQNQEVSAFDTVENTFVVSGTAFQMVWINAGTFLMGSSPASEYFHASDETLHEVTLGSGFYMSKYEVTQAQYKMVMGATITAQQALATTETRNYGQGDNYPMYYVSWYDAIVFCNKLSMLEGLSPAYYINKLGTDPDDWGDVPKSGTEFSTALWNEEVGIVPGSNGYRLPTEAQWEYSCRAGTTETYNWGTNTVNSTQANYNSRLGRTSLVGSYAPNAWGLYDMHGNVEEWCWDWYDYYGRVDGAVTDPSGPPLGNWRIYRGGNFIYGFDPLRSAARGVSLGSPELRYEGRGFRIIRPE